MRRTLVLLAAATSLVLGAGVGGAAAAAEGPPGFVTQDRSIFECDANPGMHRTPDASRRNLGGRCL